MSTRLYIIPTHVPPGGVGTKDDPWRPKYVTRNFSVIANFRHFFVVRIEDTEEQLTAISAQPDVYTQGDTLSPSKRAALGSLITRRGILGITDTLEVNRLITELVQWLKDHAETAEERAAAFSDLIANGTD